MDKQSILKIEHLVLYSCCLLSFVDFKEEEAATWRLKKDIGITRLLLFWRSFITWPRLKCSCCCEICMAAVADKSKFYWWTRINFKHRGRYADSQFANKNQIFFQFKLHSSLYLLCPPALVERRAPMLCNVAKSNPDAVASTTWSQVLKPK